MYLIEATVGVVDKPRNSPMRTVVSRNDPFTVMLDPIVAALSVHGGKPTPSLSGIS